MIETRTHTPTPDGAATICCAECGTLVPLERVRYREERVRVKVPRTAMARQSLGGPPLATRSRHFGTGYAYQIKRVPICLDCRRRQHTSVFGVCAFVAACALAALLIYSRDAPPPEPTTLALAPPSHPMVTTHAPDTAPSRAPKAPVVASKPLAAPPPPSAAQSASTAPQTVAPPVAAANTPAPVARATKQVATTSAASPVPQSDDQAPVWLPTHKTKAASRKSTTTARRDTPSFESVQGLRASGYSALQHRRYAQAYSQLQQATMMGDAYAPMYIGEMFQYGLGVGRDTGQASYWYGIAVNRGNAAALAAFQQLRMNPY